MRLKVMLALLAIGCTPAIAGDAASVSGVGKGKSTSMIEPVAKGHILMNSVSEYTSYVSTDPNSPFNGMKGKCWGAIEIKAPAASGQGNCAFTTASGDKNFNKWTVTGMAKDSALVGTWVVVGGTGKYQGASGGGSFHSVTDRDAGTFVNKVEGAIILK